MRKALKAATLMGLAAALIVPVSPTAKAGDMSMGDTKVSIGGNLRERLEWYASEAGSGNGRDVVGSYRARIKIKAELANGVTAVFVPQAVGVWGEGGQGLRLGELEKDSDGASATTNTVNMHEAYLLLANPFGINNVIVKVGRQEVNLGNQRLVGAVGWSMAGRSIDGILLGYVAGDYGLAGLFYGKLNQGDYGLGAWANPKGVSDIDLYVATWQGKFKPWGIGGTYEITDIFVQPTAHDFNINTLYGRVTPVIGMDFGKLKFNVEGAFQSGDAPSGGDFGGYMFSVGAGATFTNVAWKPSLSINYDFYSGDDKDNEPGDDIDAFWSVLPTAHKWLGHSDELWIGNVYSFNGAGLVNMAGGKIYPGVQDLYGTIAINPLPKLHLALTGHYFKTDEDYAVGTGSSDDIGWETDLEGKYKYSKNLCFLFGWDHFDPDSDFGNAYLDGGDDALDHFYVQAELKF